MQRLATPCRSPRQRGPFYLGVYWSAQGDAVVGQKRRRARVRELRLLTLAFIVSTAVHLLEGGPPPPTPIATTAAMGSPGMNAVATPVAVVEEVPQAGRRPRRRPSRHAQKRHPPSPRQPTPHARRSPTGQPPDHLDVGGDPSRHRPRVDVEGFQEAMSCTMRRCLRREELATARVCWQLRFPRSS